MADRPRAGLDEGRLSVAFGVVGAAEFGLMGVGAMMSDWGGMMGMMGSFGRTFFGPAITPLGGMTMLVSGFFWGALAGFAIAWVYNRL